MVTQAVDYMTGTDAHERRKEVVDKHVHSQVSLLHDGSEQGFTNP